MKLDDLKISVLLRERLHRTMETVADMENREVEWVLNRVVAGDEWEFLKRAGQELVGALQHVGSLPLDVVAFQRIKRPGTYRRWTAADHDST